MKPKYRGKSALPAGVVGLTLTLAGAACAGSAHASAKAEIDTAKVRAIDLAEVELFEVTLASFQPFDREGVAPRAGDGRIREAYCRGCRGCRGCRA